MSVRPIRYAWFPPAVPKRKHDRDFDNECGWPSTGLPLSEPAPEPRPTKRLRHIEGGLAKLSLRPKSLNEPAAIDIDPEIVAPSSLSLTNVVSGSPLGGETEPIIYGYASPHTGARSSASLTLRGELYGTNTSDEERGMRDDMERPQGRGIGNSVTVHGEDVMPGYTVQEPESTVHEKRKRDVGDDERGLEKKGKPTWYEPEKDRIIVLDLDSSEDESVTNSPRRRRSAFSQSSTSSSRSRPRNHRQNDETEYIINPTLLSYISSVESGAPSVPREDNPAQALVLYKPPPWAAGAPPEEPEVADIEDVAPRTESSPIEPSPLIEDDAMDIDS